MREPWFAMALIAVGACDDSIWVEVRTGAVGKTDHVELFIGTDECKLDNGEACNGIQPPSFDRHLLGRVLYRDSDDGFTQTVDGKGSAWFRFVASAQTVTILAVGTAGDMPTGAASLEPQALFEGPLHIIANLEPAAALIGAKPGELGVNVWRTHAGTACAGVGNDPKSRVFVVPQSDRDCDDVQPMNECDPLAYRTMTATPDPADPTCVAPFVTSVGVQACQLGGPTCNEITNVRTKCDSVGLCVPDALCSACASGFTRECIATSFEAPNTTRLVCTLQVQDAGGGQFQPCTDPQKSTAPVDLDATAVLMQSCTGLPTFASLEMAPYGAFLPEAIVPTGLTDTIKLTPKNLSGKCKFDLVPEGNVDGALVPADATPGPRQDAGIVNMAFKGATTATARSILLPLDLRFVSTGCGQASACTLAPATASMDRVFACGR
jgi:hypothetical protein